MTFALTTEPSTDPTSIYRYRDGLYAVELLTAAITEFDFFTSLKDRPVCQDMVKVLRTGKPANFGSSKNEKEWAKAMEGEDFANRFTAAMDCRGVYLAQAAARRLDFSRHHHLLDIAGGSGIYACSFAAHHPHLRATVFEKPPVDEIARRQIASRGFTEG